MDLTALVREHGPDIDLFRELLGKTIANLRKEMELSRRELHHLAELLVDEALLFRFLKKYKYDITAAHSAFLSHIDWRLQNDLPNQSLASVTPNARHYLQKGLFQFLRTDKLGRPVAILNLRHYNKNQSPQLLETNSAGTAAARTQMQNSSGPPDYEDMRSLFVLSMEVARRLVQSLNEEFQRRRDWSASDLTAGSSSSSSSTTSSTTSLDIGALPADRVVTQMAIIIDLEGVGMNNLKYDMIPLFHDLFSNHFPQTIGTVYVLNYGWIHAGIWSVMKAALPADATKKLVFLTPAQLQNHIDPENIPTMFGGSDSATYNLARCPVFSHFAQPNYHCTSPRVHRQLTLLDVEDEGYHEDDNDIWFDAVEGPMTPCRSAADLQNLLRVSSGRNLHGMNRVGSAKSLKSLAMASPGTAGLLTPSGIANSRSSPHVSQAYYKSPMHSPQPGTLSPRTSLSATYNPYFPPLPKYHTLNSDTNIPSIRFQQSGSAPVPPRRPRRRTALKNTLLSYLGPHRPQQQQQQITFSQQQQQPPSGVAKYRKRHKSYMFPIGLLALTLLVATTAAALRNPRRRHQLAKLLFSTAQKAKKRGGNGGGSSSNSNGGGGMTRMVKAVGGSDSAVVRSTLEQNKLFLKSVGQVCWKWLLLGSAAARSALPSKSSSSATTPPPPPPSSSFLSLLPSPSQQPSSLSTLSLFTAPNPPSTPPRAKFFLGPLPPPSPTGGVAPLLDFHQPYHHHHQHQSSAFGPSTAATDVAFVEGPAVVAALGGALLRGVFV
ncbi:hypothetical protein DFS34DRAFT_616358 [Phlyctochytrium arcticum]|nr:hypothetical protein DFS34DRAFT_616358 [Phlyctochytrium arcticum]